jgi:hypothetical protein
VLTIKKKGFSVKKKMFGGTAAADVIPAAHDDADLSGWIKCADQLPPRNELVHLRVISIEGQARAVIDEPSNYSQGMFLGEDDPLLPLSWISHWKPLER